MKIAFLPWQALPECQPLARSVCDRVVRIRSHDLRELRGRSLKGDLLLWLTRPISNDSLREAVATAEKTGRPVLFSRRMKVPLVQCILGLQIIETASADVPEIRLDGLSSKIKTGERMIFWIQAYGSDGLLVDNPVYSTVVVNDWTCTGSLDVRAYVSQPPVATVDQKGNDLIFRMPSADGNVRYLLVLTRSPREPWFDAGQHFEIPAMWTLDGNTGAKTNRVTGQPIRGRQDAPEIFQVTNEGAVFPGEVRSIDDLCRSGQYETVVIS